MGQIKNIKLHIVTDIKFSTNLVAHKLRTLRREQRWDYLGYKKAHLGTALKANPFGGASHAKGIVLEKVGVEAKQPNSAIRSVCVCSLSKMVKRSQLLYQMMDV